MSKDDRIKDALDRAETYDGSGEINWGEVDVQTIFDYALLHNIRNMDINSVKSRILEHWRNVNEYNEAQDSPSQSTE